MGHPFSSPRAEGTKEWDDESYRTCGPSPTMEDDLSKLLRDEISALEPHQRKHWQSWEGREYAIPPHTDAAGHTYYIGDLYEGIKCQQEWEIKQPQPYLKYVKDLAKTIPHLSYLGHWMEVTAAPPKWKYLKCFPGNREDRAKRAKVCVVDYTKNTAPTKTGFENDVPALQQYLQGTPQSAKQVQTRLIIVEDLSRDLVEMLGSYYDIDPQFFLSHIDDYLFNNPRDPWVDLPSLDIDARKRNHFNLQYLRTRYFESEADFQQAERDSGNFNVLRRIDSDRSRQRLMEGLLDKPGDSVTLTRAKTSLWWKPREPGQPVTAILLVDPTVSTGKPIWGGYRPFQSTPSMATWRQNQTQPLDAPPQTSLFEDMVYWSLKSSDTDLDLIERDERNIALFAYRMVIADWLITLKYVTTTLTKIEWEFEKPHWDGNFSNIEQIIKKLSPWRRNIGHYQAMITGAIARLFPPEVRAPLHGIQPFGTAVEMGGRAPLSISEDEDRGVRALYTDFQNVKQQMTESQIRIRTIENIAMNGINYEEARRAVKQNGNLTRLTGLASIFIPLNFTTSFLSMTPDFSAKVNSFWLFFAIGVPLTLLALLAVDLLHPDRNGFLLKRAKRLWRKMPARKDQQPLLPTTNKSLPSARPSPVLRHKTINWFSTDSGRLGDTSRL